jgi:solute carrier family 25 2-oxodicarboxylate transporter 21
MASGALATFPEILAISPFEVAKLGLQVDTTNKYNLCLMAFMKDMYKTRGISGLYCGWFGMQCRQIHFYWYFFGTVGTFRKKFRDNGSSPTVAKLGGGFLAGCLGAIGGNIPSDVVRSVVQKKAFSDPARKTYGISPAGVIEHITVAREIIAANGLKGLYTGWAFKTGYKPFNPFAAIISLATVICSITPAGEIPYVFRAGSENAFF